ncbi:MAG: hypothetical protein M3N29_03645 [Chloroflexota bacterium]|nr:hypothetical protein [Chloroflexota bacterium]
MAARLVGAASGVVTGLLAGLVPSLAGPGLLALIPGESAEYALGVVTVALSGAAVGPRLLQAARGAALFFGWLWALTTFVALVLAVSAAKVIAFVAENVLLPDLGRELALILLGLVYGFIYLLPALVVAGPTWATLARLLNRIVDRRDLGRAQRQLPRVPFARGALAVLGSAVVVAGMALGVSGRPESTRCLDVGGEVPRSGA